MSTEFRDGSWLDTLPPEEMRRIVDALYRVHHLYGEITNRDTLLRV